MERGYFRIWRKSIDSIVFADPSLWHLWSWCLMRSTYKKRHVPFRCGKGTIIVSLDEGQFIFGRNSASKELNVSASTIWKRLKKLEMLECVKIESNNQYSIVSICNWGLYQQEGGKKEQPSDNQVTAEEQPSDTNKKGNKGKKEIYMPFNDFYNNYPKKKGKQDAVKAWNKLKVTQELLAQILSSLEKQKQSDDWKKDNGQFIPYPSTYLNGRRWEDEIADNKGGGEWY